MPLSITHALVPVAAAIALSRPLVHWRLVAWAAVAAMAPDLDSIGNPLFGLQANSIYSHRGFTHSLFVALGAGLVAAMLHRSLRARPLTAAVAVGGAMASHGLIDMMTDTGSPVAILWPLSSTRLCADWRPIHGGELELSHWATQLPPRLESELWQLILPMLAIALAIRGCRSLGKRLSSAVPREGNRA
jgi:inner membrane protein